MKNNNKKRIALGILLGTIGIFSARLYLRERQNEIKKRREEEKKKELVAREDVDKEMSSDVKTLCISILKRDNPPTKPELFLRELIALAMLGGDKLLEKMPRSIREMEDMLAEFKIYREYSRLCYSKLGHLNKEQGVAIIVGKL